MASDFIFAGVFCLGSVATAAAAAASFALLSGAMGAVGVDGDGWKVAAALAAKNVGGGLNYVAVASALGVSPPTFAAGITADNFCALVYFPIVSWLGGPPRGDEAEGNKSDDEWKETGKGAEGDREAAAAAAAPTVGELTVSLALSCFMVSAAHRVAPPSLGALPTATALAVAFATFAPTSWTRTLALAGDTLGNVLLFVFFASVGGLCPSNLHLTRNSRKTSSKASEPPLSHFFASSFFFHVSCVMRA